MAYSIKMSGQDITQYVDQLSIQVNDTLGQSSGAGSSGATQGRAATFKFNTNLGPMSQAIGAGQPIPVAEGAMSFAGTSASNIALPSGLNPAGWTKFSFDFWIYIVSTNNNYSNILWNWNGGNTAGVGIFFDINTTNLNIVLSDGTNHQTVALNGLSVGVWQHVGASWDGATVKTYLNGVLNVTNSYTGGIGTAANNFTIGSTNYPVNIGEVAVYNGALSGVRFQAHYTSGLNSISAYVTEVKSDNPRAYYRMNELAGTVAKDSSGNGYNGTISNTVTLNVSGPLKYVPSLVRQGEVIITDATGTVIFGGYATKYTDTSTSVVGQTKQNFTAVEGIDYSTSLQRTLVSEVFSAQTDIQIIKSVMQKYAPWVNLQYLPTSPNYTFPAKALRNVTVEQVLQGVAGVTGFIIFVDYLKNLHYVPPTAASSAPYNLSDQPDFLTTFPHAVSELLLDDNSAINRVFFFGGTRLSNNFTQDVSPLANGNNKVFPLVYHPSPTTDGTIHVTVNGSAQVVGFANSTGPTNTLKSAGGLADCLVDTGSPNVTFDVAPGSGATVLVTYRFSFPLSVVLTDENSHKFFGSPYLDGYINDSSVFDLTTAIQRCKVLLAQQSLGLLTLKVDVYNKPGVQAGMVIHLVNALRGINATYLVQEVEIEPLGGGNFLYHYTLGAWNWNLIDFLLKLPTLSSFADDNLSEVTDFVTIIPALYNVQVHDAWSKIDTRTPPYYARSAPVGDGHDAYPGLCTST